MAQLKYWDGSSWVDAVVGAQGIQGPIGVTGIQGIQGTQGVQGTQGLFGAQGIQGVAATFTQVNAQGGTGYTFTATDADQLINLTYVSSAWATIPTNASVPFPIGTVVHVAGVGSGIYQIQAVTPATTSIQSTGNLPASPYLRTRYSSADCIKTGVDNWLVVGDII